MLAVKELKQLLLEHAFLKGMEERYIDRIAEFARLKVVKPGEYLYRNGDPADCCYLLRDGCVAIELYHPSRGPVTLQTVGADKVLGWSWLVPPYEWKFDGRAIELTRGICIEAGHLREECERDHEFGYQILKRFVPIIAERLEATRIQLLDLFGPGT
jgi:CRP-like cAMP-binding protein